VADLFNAMPNTFLRVPTAAMEPTFPAGALLVREPIIGPIAHDDLVLYRIPGTENDSQLAGRVVAVPGDQVQLDNTHAFVNGEVSPDHGHPFSGIRIGFAKFPAWNQTYVVPAGSYYILPDNRDEGTGSLDFGAVSQESILGHLSTWSEVTRHKGRMAAIFLAFLAPLKSRLPFDAAPGFRMQDVDVVDDTSIKVTYEVDTKLFDALQHRESDLVQALRDELCGGPVARLALGLNVTSSFVEPTGSKPITVKADQGACPGLQ
jgi:signal peptidase I